jgi:molybdopterin-synthase adenylyltransferase
MSDDSRSVEISAIDPSEIPERYIRKMGTFSCREQIFLLGPRVCVCLGAAKATTAAIRVRQINPSVQIRIHDVFQDSRNAARLIEGADVAVDCLDNLKTRFVMEKAAKAAGSPLVSAAIAGACGHITSIFPEDQVPAKGVEAVLGPLAFTEMVMACLECSEITKILLKRGNLLRTGFW